MNVQWQRSETSRIRNLAILTGGGDCPGLNPILRAVVKSAIGTHGLRVFGFLDGFAGLVENRYRPLEWSDAADLIARGGTILGSSNKADPFHFYIEDEPRDLSDLACHHLRQLEIDRLICVGGDGTLAGARRLCEAKGIPILGIPKTIDNDLPGTERIVGFDSAVATVTEALDRIHTTAESHHRIMIVEVMGRNAGWLALHSGLASGADVILIPELPYDPRHISVVCAERNRRGRSFSIIVVAEGAGAIGADATVAMIDERSPDPVRLGGIGQALAAQLAEHTDSEIRVTKLGHLQRGGVPSPFDRLLGTRFGVAAVEAAVRGEHGVVMVVDAGRIIAKPFAAIPAGQRKVEPDDELLAVARAVGISFGVPGSGS